MDPHAARLEVREPRQIIAAYNAVRGGADREFAWDAADTERGARYAALASELNTDMHEVIGHASGQIDPGVAPIAETLKNYSSTLEEARADLVALYYAVDPKLVELGLMPSVEVGQVQYERYIRNGLQLQLYRVPPGADIEQDHMRNRQLIAAWCYEQGKANNVIERRERDGTTYFVVNDFVRLRELFGELLRELQRIKSEGDYAAGCELVERYAVKLDRKLHAEVLERYAKLDIPPFSGLHGPASRSRARRREDRRREARVPDDFGAHMSSTRTNTDSCRAGTSARRAPLALQEHDCGGAAVNSSSRCPRTRLRRARTRRRSRVPF